MENKSIIKRIKDYFVKQKSIRQLAFSTLKGVQKGIGLEKEIVEEPGVQIVYQKWKWFRILWYMMKKL